MPASIRSMVGCFIANALSLNHRSLICFEVIRQRIPFAPYHGYSLAFGFSQRRLASTRIFIQGLDFWYVATRRICCVLFLIYHRFQQSDLLIPSRRPMFQAEQASPAQPSEGLMVFPIDHCFRVLIAAPRAADGLDLR